MNLEIEMNKKKSGIISLVLITIIIVSLISFCKYRGADINYYNSDATWHALLVIEAYNETPISDHLFLPIVTLGEDEDKWIPWGAAVADEKGNYYYTSFSPAGYFLPWLFMKVCNLPVEESSLYVFNTMLFLLSAVCWVVFIYCIYEKNKYKETIAIIGVLTYVLAPEVLHGMGVVYWHQSIMQVTLLIQIISFYEMKRRASKFWRIVFYIMTLVNPYIEWTGYVANIGFALAEFFVCDKRCFKRAFSKAVLIGIISVLSFLLFVFHYLTRLDASDFGVALKNRFMARNITTTTELVDVFSGYLESFLYIWVLIVVLIILNFIISKKIEIANGILVFILSFPILENIVMKEHAVTYSYDRMKGAFLLSFLVCELISFLLENAKKKEFVVAIIFILSSILNLSNFNSYIRNDFYVWEANYKKENEILAKYIREKYSSSIIGTKNANETVRGYLNLLMECGVYEGRRLSELQEIAERGGKRYVIVLNIDDSDSISKAKQYGLDSDMLESLVQGPKNGAGLVYDLSGVDVYDLDTKVTTKVTVEEEEIFETIISLDGGIVCQVDNLSDMNWDRGCSLSGDTLLFSRQDELLIELLAKNYIKCEFEVFHIERIYYDENWIHVILDRDASVCKYPSVLTIE